MRKAMANSIVGDDVYKEDQTTINLENRCAKLFGKEAGLFVVSGTMGNLLAVMAHCQRGDEIIVGKHNHIHRWEQGNYAQIGGISATTLNCNDDGTMNLAEIEEAIRVKAGYSDKDYKIQEEDSDIVHIPDCHMPATRLICIENTHNFTGGKALPVEWMSSVQKLAQKHNLKVHMDGARIYNAAIASKTLRLGAPIGSIIVGPLEFIDKARHIRKAIGGGWRQSGVLAAAAHVALDNAEVTITRDNQRAVKLAKMINDVTPSDKRSRIFAQDKDITNMVLVHCDNVQKFTAFFQERDVLVMAFDTKRIRMVLNWGVNDEHLEKIVKVYQEYVEQM
ncbi:unnamed protein product [Caenorhabditis angaria]|uniref:Aromatic amino acid beta-eliminating lyase/threonine aldolase domain-containing protein n=1 Tax=Caenorhabditis angaria TaxID=860376 RepID=A0A9P1IPQ8_9PELO|nr:unnamed protein product [Caenorhabditis angaria]